MHTDSMPSLDGARRQSPKHIWNDTIRRKNGGSIGRKADRAGLNQHLALIRSRNDSFKADFVTIGADYLQGRITGGGNIEFHLLDILLIFWFDHHFPAAFPAGGQFVIEMVQGELQRARRWVHRSDIRAAKIG